MTDSHSGASVVAVDSKAESEVRHQLAVLAVQSSLATVPDVRQLIVLSDVAYTVPYILRVVVQNKDYTNETKEKIASILKEGLELCDKTLNSFNPASEVSQVNNLPVNEPHKLSPIFLQVMECVSSVVRSSGGSCDPSLSPVIYYARKYAEENDGASPLNSSNPGIIKEFAELLETCNFNDSFSLNLKHGTIARKTTLSKLDLGSVSKGFTVDYVIDKLLEAGFKDALFDWGGDMKGVGKNLYNEIWRVGIIEPPKIEDIPKSVHKLPGGNFIRVMTLNNEAVATTGDYGHPVITPGGILSGVFSTKLGRLIAPRAMGIAQASVKSPSCMYADALATAAFVKEHVSTARQYLQTWRYLRNGALDYCFYSRQEQLVARMHQIATEDDSMKANRISMSFPARVIIVGGGLAGLCAAVEAARCGASVVLIEKEKSVGGNSAKATSGINAWGTMFQVQRNIPDGGKYFERDTFLSGDGGTCDFGLVKTLSVKSREAIHFLSTDIGIPLTTLFQLGGHSRPRTHRVADKPDGTPVPVGFTIIRAMLDYIKAHFSSKVTIMTSTRVVALVDADFHDVDETPRKRVKGVRYSSLVPEGEGFVSVEGELNADSVILTCGGFGNDHAGDSLLHEFAPKIENMATTNGPFATGDGVKMARALGAGLVDMDKVQLHPTGFIDPKDPQNPTKYLGPEALRGSGGILLNTRGERFVNELGLRSVVSQAVLDQGSVFPNSECRFAWCVLNKKAMHVFGVGQLGFYKDKIGLFRDCANLGELAAAIGCPEAVLGATLADYERACHGGRCPKTQKTVFPCSLGPEGPFVVAAITPVIHYCMGGLVISPSTEVQMEVSRKSVFGRNKPILGLFGAGEVTGGVHGGNRLGGNSLLECVVFGRIAGDRAATVLQKQPCALSTSEWTTVVLREVRVGPQYGHGIRVFRFNLPGAWQMSGLRVGQYVAIKGEWDGRQLLGYYSPITLPHDYGVIGILARVDKGTLSEWMSAMQPGDAVMMKACGGLVIERVPEQKCFSYQGQLIRKIGMIAGGTGVAPMVQILRAAMKHPFSSGLESLNLIYAAEEQEELAFLDLLKSLQKDSSGPKTVKFDLHVVLNNPPPGWTGGVGFVETSTIQQYFIPPASDVLTVICGPPVMQRVVKQVLSALKYPEGLVTTVDQVPQAKI
jgi:flavocytochrome c